jgi:dTDP-4-dehydrorhamnose reductase/S-adenosylmethionine synthetase
MKVHLPQDRSSPKSATQIKKIDDWSLRFPTSVEDVAKVLKLMIDKLSSKDLKDTTICAGTYHVASPHGCTKYTLLKLQSKILGIPSDIVNQRAVGDSTGPPSTSAPRPQCTQLDCADTWSAIGQEFEFVTLEDGMKRALCGFPERFL